MKSRISACRIRYGSERVRSIVSSSKIGGEAANAADAGEDVPLWHAGPGHAKAEFGGAQFVSVALQFVAHECLVTDDETIGGELAEAVCSGGWIECAPAVAGVAGVFR